MLHHEGAVADRVVLEDARLTICRRSTPQGRYLELAMRNPREWLSADQLLQMGIDLIVVAASELAHQDD